LTSSRPSSVGFPRPIHPRFSTNGGNDDGSDVDTPIPCVISTCSIRSRPASAPVVREIGARRRDFKTICKLRSLYAIPWFITRRIFIKTNSWSVSRQIGWGSRQPGPRREGFGSRPSTTDDDGRTDGDMGVVGDKPTYPVIDSAPSLGRVGKCARSDDGREPRGFVP